MAKKIEALTRPFLNQIRLTEDTQKWHIGRVERMFKKIAILSTWFLLTPLAIALLLALFTQYRHMAYLAKVGPEIASAKEDDRVVEGEVLGVEVTDMRPIYVANFLKGTRLAPYSDYMVEVADKYGIDYRLIPAIAMKESGGGNAINEASHNAWGWENGRTQFPSWEVAIDTVGRTLKTRYVDKGLDTPDKMMPVYAPPQMLTGGKWARDVNYFFSKMTQL